MTQYESKFFELLPYMDYLKDEKLLVNHFIRGLNVGITGPGSLRVAIEKALIAEKIQVKPQDTRDKFQN